MTLNTAFLTSFKFRLRERNISSMLMDLQSCEDEIKEINRTLRKRNGDVASDEKFIMGCFSEHQAVLPTTSSMAEGKLTGRFEILEEEGNVSRQSLESNKKNTILTRTALTRIMAFIEHHESQRESFLRFLREADLNFASIIKESEQENDLLKAKHYVNCSDILPESTMEEAQMFSPTEERLAPCHVESIQLTMSILNNIAAIAVSVREKERIRVSYRKHLENAHVKAQEQLANQRVVLRGARNAIGALEEKLRDFRTKRAAQEKVQAQLVAELEELDFGKNSKEELEHLDKVNEEERKKKEDLVTLESALDYALLETQDAKLEDSKAKQEADSHAAALELARETLYDSSQRLASIENDKQSLQDLLEKNTSLREKHMKDVESKNYEINVLQDDIENSEESKRILDQETESLFVSVVDIKKNNELLRALLDAIEIRKEYFQSVQKNLDKNLTSIRTKSLQCRNELLNVQESVRVSRIEEAELMKNINYITFLQPDDDSAHLSMTQLNNVHDETPRGFLAHGSAQIFEKARRQHRRYTKGISIPSVEPVVQQQELQESKCMNVVIDEEQISTGHSLPGDVTQQQQQETERYSMTATHNSTLHCSRGNGLMATSLSPRAEYIPTSTTSRIVANYIEGNSSEISKTRAGIASPLPVAHEGLSSPYNVEKLKDTYIYNLQNQVLSEESTATVARVNLCLQEILSRKY